jgi:hypothetical protein
MATRTPEEIEEERRLLYVAMTRARDELDLIVPQRFYTFQQSKTGDRHVYACRSRFIPDAVVDCFECRGWRERVQESNRPTKKPGSTTDVAASLLRMVAGQLLGFFAELGFIFPRFPFIAHSRGWSHEDMENNVAIIRNSKEFADGACMLAKRLLDLAASLIAQDHLFPGTAADG